MTTGKGRARPQGRMPVEKQHRANPPPNEAEAPISRTRREVIVGGLVAGLAGLTGLAWRWGEPALRPGLSTGQAQARGEQRRINLTRILDHIAVLTQPAWTGRRAGSIGEAKAGEYIARLWQQWGLQPQGEAGTYFQTFPLPDLSLVMAGERWRLVGGGSGGVADNLIGFLPGRDARLRQEIVAVAAHYDHLGQTGEDYFPGANDNASGVAVILELARLMALVRPRRSMVFFAFSGEEAGLLGSRYFVAHPTVPLDRICGLVNFDAVGNGNPGDFVFWSGEALPWQEAIAEAARCTGIRVERQNEVNHSSDHQPFLAAGVPAVTVTSASWLIENHTPQDKPAGVNTAKLQKITEWGWHVLQILTAGSEK
ncbi:MAG: M28 family peptidase [Heliobacteriaceae bacterium]|nr:M28 family peptidase [Heliobacteriaceae bacterium]